MAKYYPTFELGFLDDLEDLENVSEIFAETSQASEDQQRESATGENNTCTCTCMHVSLKVLASKSYFSQLFSSKT